MNNLRYGDIVPTDVSYSYNIMNININALKNTFPFLELGTIGYSVLGKPIPYIRLGYGPKEVMYNASFHANEWITSVLLMKFVENYSKSYVNNGFLYGNSIRNLFQQVSIYIIPMVNPDGVDLVTGALESSSAIFQNYQQIANNFPQIPFPSGWKANFNGVDLKNFQPFLYC